MYLLFKQYTGQCLELHIIPIIFKNMEIYKNSSFENFCFIYRYVYIHKNIFNNTFAVKILFSKTGMKLDNE